MPKQESKKKKIVFDDTDIRHAQLKLRLQHDGLTQAEFFRCMITGYIEKDQTLIKYVQDYKASKDIQNKVKRKKIQKDIESGDNLLAKFGLGDDDLENIFDLIAEEHPDL
jgi:polygalacturonase